MHTSTPVRQASQKKQKPPAPLRGPSKDTLHDINYHPKHPFTKTVGLTILLPASTKQLYFFLQMFDLDLKEHIVEQTNHYTATTENHNRDWKLLTDLEFQSFLKTMMLMGMRKLSLCAQLLINKLLFRCPLCSLSIPKRSFC